jgi:hypothetical protein
VPGFITLAVVDLVIDHGHGHLRDVAVWQNDVQTALIDPGKPWENGVDESFNGRLRDECLSAEWFRSRREAKVIIDDLASALQCSSPAFEPRLPHSERVQTATPIHQPGRRSKVTNGPKIPGQVSRDSRFDRACEGDYRNPTNCSGANTDRCRRRYSR